ncbi:MAG: threonine-phosphate decarboxylase [Rhodospirillales bacterium]|nr:threonine-phosphate decarboxylase [Rhodospirillales bacterium]
MDTKPAVSPDLFRHGGNLDAAKAVFGSHLPWLDLSTGINPVAYPLPTIPARVWQRLPDAAAIGALRHAAARYFGVPGISHLVEAPGTQAILQVLPAILDASHVAIVSPTYNEHARCWADGGINVSEIMSIDELPAAADILVVVNPNNPDGRQQAPGQLLELASRMAARGGMLIVDEAFCDVSPELSLASHADTAGVLVLRSFGKFFGLAGARLGFALGAPALMAVIGQRLGPWAVSGPALETGAQAYADERWITATRLRLARDRQDLSELLAGHDIAVIGGTDLFVLARTVTARALWQHLAEQGVWTRLFDHSPHWIRLGLPGQEAEWNQLRAALEIGSPSLSRARQII